MFLDIFIRYIESLLLSLSNYFLKDRSSFKRTRTKMLPRNHKDSLARNGSVVSDSSGTITSIAELYTSGDSKDRRKL